LIYVGSLNKDGGTFALLAGGTDEILNLATGDLVGRRSGVILNITAFHIKVCEVFYDHKTKRWFASILVLTKESKKIQSSYQRTDESCKNQILEISREYNRK